MLYANTTTLPGLLQSLFGYDATTSGLVLSPAGIGAVVVLFIVGALLSRGVDARYLMTAGLLTMAAGNYWMSQLKMSYVTINSGKGPDVQILLQRLGHRARSCPLLPSPCACLRLSRAFS